MIIPMNSFSFVLVGIHLLPWSKDSVDLFSFIVTGQLNL
ncbi:hypothetical protein DSOL_1133 [Desulfosporosinus metallidurans]|uniref:Uncharacterized protein n=1 Tax=Desulfosporosinus metallidurans TaxID=1888891 RepID=A0A1Q8R079_9FIRM|nr:hypothetical protein DSOL_1133 [Desulfosporosinus metallidurans]